MNTYQKRFDGIGVTGSGKPFNRGGSKINSGGGQKTFCTS